MGNFRAEGLDLYEKWNPEEEMSPFISDDNSITRVFFGGEVGGSMV